MKILGTCAVAVTLFILTGSAFAQTSTYAFSQGTIEDEKVYGQLESGARKLMDNQKIPALNVLEEQLQRVSCRVDLKPHRSQKNYTNVYEHCRKSVLIVGTLYKCPNCPNDHARSASGFVISEEGIAVTSYHIFRSNQSNHDTDLAHVVMDVDGNVYPIVEVLAASLKDDIAIFRIDGGGKKFVPMPLAEPVVGEEASIISHPHSMYYSFTKGNVSRLYARDGGEKMSVTADFAQGSSGGPVINNHGEVIGVVSASRALYHSDQNVQMVSKEAIPTARIRALIVQ